MRVVFSDESGTSREQDEPNTVVAAIMIDMDESWSDLDFSIEDMLKDAGIHKPEEYEIKATRLMRDLRRARAHPSAQHQQYGERAAKIWEGSLKLLFRHRIPVFAAAVDRASYRRVIARLPEHFRTMLSDYTAAFVLCLAESDEYVHHALRDEQILWISDHAGHYEPHLTESIALMRASVVFGDGETSIPPVVTHVADTIYFGHSSESRALQLADLCASTIAYHLRAEPLAENAFKVLERRLVRDVRPLVLRPTLDQK